ncbi:uncharacterized protein LOC108090152 [Drosophila ficusphila]|uniref:uncharacterized protein LOC108090152 n=1 Tax=Drosophila ficusphila TaxID=30025 RepID=UPI0007E685E8|nr:uncharacterized protein LOC108090152 [Drosophila ficusphila]
MQSSVNCESASKCRNEGGILKRSLVGPPTFDVTQLSSSGLASRRGVQLPPLMEKGQIRPDQVDNARFRVVEFEPRSLSEQQFNALIKRLVKCFMSEVEITKRLRKVTARRSVNPTDLQLIGHLEALRRSYEAERSVLVVKLSLDSRFNLYASHAMMAGEMPSSKSAKSRKSNPYETIPKKDKVPEITSRKHEHDGRSRHRQSGGSLTTSMSRKPIVCDHIVTPENLSLRLREKLYILQETSEHPLKSTKTEEDSQDSKTAVKESTLEVRPSSSDIFYDIPDMDEP